MELNDDHLDALKVPLGHKLKILKRIKMMRSEKGMTVPESRQGARPRPDGDPTNNSGAEVKPVTNADYSELPAPVQVSQGSNTGKTLASQPVKSALKTNGMTVTAVQATLNPSQSTA